MRSAFPFAAAACAALGYGLGANAEDLNNRSDLIGEIARHVTIYTDTLVDLAPRYRIGFVELRAANPGVNAWVPGDGVELILPTAHLLPDGARRGIVINLADMRLYYFRESRPPLSYPIGIGRDAWETPLGLTEIVAKRVDPTWIPPPSIRAERPDLPAAIGPGRANPLGSRALYLGLDAYVVHGTNKPEGVGRHVSHGCIRMYEADVRELFDQVEIGTPVAIIYQTVKLGWARGELYLEVHPSRDQAEDVEATGTFAPAFELGVEGRILSTINDPERIDWDAVGRALRERRGIPVRITSTAETD